MVGKKSIFNQLLFFHRGYINTALFILDGFYSKLRRTLHFYVRGIKAIGFYRENVTSSLA